MQRNFVNTSNPKAAFKLAIRLKNDVDPRKKGKAKRESKKGKKAKVDKAKDEEHEDKGIDYVGIDKVLEKGPNDKDEGPKGNGGAAFDYNIVCPTKNFDPVESEIEYDDNKFNVPLPGAEDNLAAGIEGSFITLTSADVSDIFRPHVDRVIELIERQRNVLAAHNKTAKGVILVGGFGQSGYLYRCLKTRFADEDPPPTYTQSANPIVEEGPRFIIMQPENSWTAVVRGAVLTGLERDLVAIRKARRHYGVVVTQRYDPSKHSRKNRYVCAYTQEIRANNQMMWHVVRGQDMPSDTPILLELGQDFWPNEEVDIDETEIIVSEADEPPNEYEPSGDMRVLCTLKSNLSAIPKKHFKKRVSHGRQYRHLTQDYGMSFDGRLTFDQRVDGKVHASIQAIYT
ncbi:hypothetical protein D6D04_06638 [Aureobasidium pullulans]|nr:hypothetical protein D6D04_06638 [Aureobasidium pullulans]